MEVDLELRKHVESIAEEIESSVRKGRLGELLQGALELKRLQSLVSGKWETRGYELTMAWGGPGIWFNTWDCEVEGRWGLSEYRKKLPRDVCDEVDDYLNEIYGGI